MEENTPNPASPAMLVVVTEQLHEKYGPLLTLGRDASDRYAFSFGLGKARLILASIDHIRAFVAKHEKGAK